MHRNQSRISSQFWTESKTFVGTDSKTFVAPYTLYNRLGLEGAPVLSPADVCQTVMERGASLGLVNGGFPAAAGGFPAAAGLVLRRARVMGETRLELTGVSPAALAGFKALGCFTEIIQWKTRVFVPTNDISVLARILEEHPVASTATRDAA